MIVRVSIRDFATFPSCFIENVHTYIQAATTHYHFQVEAWLNSLLSSMVATIRHELTEAVVSYEEKPRDQWIFEPPAQVREMHLHNR